MYKHYFLLMTALLVISSGCRAQKSKLSPSNEEQTMLVGTYTDASAAQGVYVYRFNQNMGTAKMVSVVKASNPSYVIATSNICSNWHNFRKSTLVQFVFGNFQYLLILIRIIGRL